MQARPVVIGCGRILLQALQAEDGLRSVNAVHRGSLWSLVFKALSRLAEEARADETTGQGVVANPTGHVVTMTRRRARGSERSARTDPGIDSFFDPTRWSDDPCYGGRRSATARKDTDRDDPRVARRI
jgi:hypothetical protein